MNTPASRRTFVLLLLSVFFSPLSVAAVSVAAGSEHSLVLQDDGSVWAWGKNHSGQLGNGTTQASASPIKLPSLTNVTAIAAGGYHNLALLADGTVWAWGDNDEGQVGDGSTQDSLSPIQINGINNAIAIAAGMYHSVILTTDGSVWAWGDNSNAQLGNGSLSDNSSPSMVTNLSGISAISSGYWYSYALKNDGSIWYWGYNIHAPPVMSADVYFMTPVLYSASDWADVLAQSQTAQEVVLPGSDETVLVATSLEHTVMLRPDGTVLESNQDAASNQIATHTGELTRATEVQWTGSVSVSLTPAEAISTGILWRIEDGAWQQSGASVYAVEGDYNIEFSDNQAWTSPAPIPVKVTRGEEVVINAQFSAQQGALSVQLNAEQAQWRIATPDNSGLWHNSGQGINLVPGEYNVEYMTLPQWLSPAEEQVLVRHNSTTTLTANYTQKTGALVVRLGPDDVFNAGGQWRITGEPWRSGAMAIADLQPGPYSLEFAIIEGWQAPQNFSINLGTEGVVINATYAQLTGNPVVSAGGYVPSGVTPEITLAKNDEDISTGDVADTGDNGGSSNDTHTDSGFSPASAIDVTLVYTDLVTNTTTVTEIDYIGETNVYAFDGLHGQKYLFNANADGAIQFSIYDSEGTLIRTNGTDDDEYRFIWIAPASDTFYISVEFNDGWSTGEIEFDVAIRGTAYDFNGDGQADLLGRGDNGTTSLIYAHDGQFSKGVAAQYQIYDDTTGNWNIQAIGDFNGDKKSDLIWRAQSGQVVVWMMNGKQLIDASGATSEYVGGLAAWHIVSSGDFNGDGKSDLVWRHNHSGQIALWLMDGLKVLPTSGLVSNQAGDSSAWNIASVGDFNGDGRSDLLWRHKQLGYTAVWLMEGLDHTPASGLTSQQIDQASHWQIIASDDFDADGKTDIFWRNSDDGQLFIWFMDGIEVVDSDFVSNTLSVDSPWRLVKVGDYNGDGRADILWQEQDTGHLHAWLMNGVHPVDDISASNDASSELSAWRVVTR